MMTGSDKSKRAGGHPNTIKTIADLKPDPKNARKHGERNIGMLERRPPAPPAAWGGMVRLS